VVEKLMPKPLQVQPQLVPCTTACALVDVCNSKDDLVDIWTRRREEEKEEEEEEEEKKKKSPQLIFYFSMYLF
jgi:hypothetical protein